MNDLFVVSLRRLWQLKAAADQCVLAGHLDEATRYYEQILASLHFLPDGTEKQYLLATVLTETANIRRDQGVLHGELGAQMRYRSAFDLYYDLGDQEGLGKSALSLGACNEMMNNLAEGAGYYRYAADALKNVRQYANTRSRAFLRLSTIFTKAGIYNAAQTHMTKAFSVADGANLDEGDFSFMLQKRSILSLAMGHPERALADLQDAEAALPHPNPLRQTQLYTAYSHAFLITGQESEGRHYLGDAEQLARSHSFRHQQRQLSRIKKTYDQRFDNYGRRYVDLPSDLKLRPTNTTPLVHLVAPDSPNVRAYVDELHRITERHPESNTTAEEADLLPYRQPATLVLKGGGAKGLAFVGALQVLWKHFSFVGFAGTSAGALAAVLLAAGYEPEELDELLNAKDFTEFLDGGCLAAPFRLMSSGGCFKGEAIGNWIESLVRAKLAIHSPPRMRNLPKRAVVYASARGGGTVKFDSNGPHADVPVAVAVKASVAIPYIFPSVQFEGDYLYDGGLLNNFPYDDLVRSEPHRHLLGIYLVDNRVSNRDARPRLLSVLSAILHIVTTADDLEIADSSKDSVVTIDTTPITTLRFRLAEQERHLLRLAGRVGAIDYLERVGIGFNKCEAERARTALMDLRVHIMRRRPSRKRPHHGPGQQEH